MGISYFESAGIDTVPQFIKAKSPRRLRQLMLRNNTKHKGFVRYQDIQWIESEQVWYAWYYVNYELSEVDDVS
jgi:hypothetical protein